jgi:hypothetical protein
VRVSDLVRKAKKNMSQIPSFNEGNLLENLKNNAISQSFPSSNSLNQDGR